MSTLSNFQDGSFAAALTLEGWTTKPKCFKFLERELTFPSMSARVRLISCLVCNSPKKCVFVRVVDSCAGCAKGSKHVDLTQAAFKELADLDKGLLTVQMREATDPNGWYVCSLSMAVRALKSSFQVRESLGPQTLDDWTDTVAPTLLQLARWQVPQIIQSYSADNLD